MNATSIESPIFTLNAIDDNMFFAQPLDLDYDEPNAVAQDMTVEFVRAEQFVQTVLLPVVSVLTDTAENPPTTQHATFPAGQRNAA